MKTFLKYYQNELLSLRQKGGEFAKQHPEIAGKLDIKDGESTDPYTERLIESVAFMSAKLAQRIDDNAQNIAFHLLSALYPNLINVFPPCSVVKFETENNVSLSNPIKVDKGTNVFVKSKNGIECQFRTLYPFVIYPISITQISLLKVSRQIGGDDGWCLELKIKTNSVPLEQCQIDNLLFYINSDITENALMLYESIFSNPKRTVFIKVNNQQFNLDFKNIFPCGFSPDEAVCPIPPYSTNCFQLFQEVLHFKKKFMFFRIVNLGKTLAETGITNIDELSIIIDIKVSDDHLFQIVNNDSIILNATPVVNLFPVTSDPFRFDGTQPKYLLLADQSRDKALEIHSISELHIINNETKEDEIVQPYFSLAVDSDTNVVHDLYWLYSKESSEIRNLSGYDVYISLVDTKMNPHNIYADVVYAKTLCTNRDDTSNIPVLSKFYVDHLETAGYHATLLHKTTEPVSLIEETTTLWNLISQLSSTHLSIATAKNLLYSIRKIAEIFSAGNKRKVSELFDGIESINIEDTVQRFGAEAWRGFIKGKNVTIAVDEENIASSYLICAVINEYLSDIVSINSFVQTHMISASSKQLLASWQPTSGRKDVI